MEETSLCCKCNKTLPMRFFSRSQTHKLETERSCLLCTVKNPSAPTPEWLADLMNKIEINSSLMAFCSLCEATMQLKDWEPHRRGFKHKEKLRSIEPIPLGNSKVHCPVCKFPMKDDAWPKHKFGSKHKKALEQYDESLQRIVDQSSSTEEETMKPPVNSLNQDKAKGISRRNSLTSIGNDLASFADPITRTVIRDGANSPKGDPLPIFFASQLFGKEKDIWSYGAPPISQAPPISLESKQNVQEFIAAVETGSKRVAISCYEDTIHIFFEDSSSLFSITLSSLQPKPMESLRHLLKSDSCIIVCYNYNSQSALLVKHGFDVSKVLDIRWTYLWLCYLRRLTGLKMPKSIDLNSLLNEFGFTKEYSIPNVVYLIPLFDQIFEHIAFKSYENLCMMSKGESEKVADANPFALFSASPDLYLHFIEQSDSEVVVPSYSIMTADRLPFDSNVGLTNSSFLRVLPRKIRDKMSSLDADSSIKSVTMNLGASVRVTYMNNTSSQIENCNFILRDLEEAIMVILFHLGKEKGDDPFSKSDIIKIPQTDVWITCHRDCINEKNVVGVTYRYHSTVPLLHSLSDILSIEKRSFRKPNNNSVLFLSKSDVERQALLLDIMQKLSVHRTIVAFDGSGMFKVQPNIESNRAITIINMETDSSLVDKIVTDALYSQRPMTIFLDEIKNSKHLQLLKSFAGSVQLISSYRSSSLSKMLEVNPEYFQLFGLGTVQQEQQPQYQPQRIQNQKNFNAANLGSTPFSPWPFPSKDQQRISPGFHGNGNKDFPIAPLSHLEKRAQATPSPRSYHDEFLSEMNLFNQFFALPNEEPPKPLSLLDRLLQINDKGSQQSKLNVEAIGDTLFTHVVELQRDKLRIYASDVLKPFLKEQSVQTSSHADYLAHCEERWIDINQGQLMSRFIKKECKFNNNM